MTTQDLIHDIRSRINPAYACQPGTESYERRLCAEALEAQAAEIERLRGALLLTRGRLLIENPHAVTSEADALLYLGPNVCYPATIVR